MTISENATLFFQCPVKDYEDPDSWEGPAIAYRLRTNYDSQSGALLEALDSLVSQKEAPQLKALVIGAWAGDDPSASSEGIIKDIIKRRDRLAGLRAIFLGDIIYEENEISWIENSDVSPLLQAFPKLELFRVRGGQQSEVHHHQARLSA